MSFSFQLTLFIFNKSIVLLIKNNIIFNIVFGNDRSKCGINMLVVRFVIKNHFIKNYFYTIIIYVIYLQYNLLIYSL